MIIGMSFVVGLLVWTLLEYLIHRFVFHERALGKKLPVEHLKHHAEVDYFAPFRLKLSMAAVVVGPLFVVGFFAPVFAWTGIGIISGWLAYEVLHWRIHVAAPIGRYGRWARRHHLAHHFGNSTKNHGVSSPIWDWVFGTLVVPATVHVPKKHVAKFPWLLDPSSSTPAVRPAWTSDYSVSGAQ